MSRAPRCDLVSLARFAHQCSTLFNAGVSLVEALRILSENESHADLRLALQGVVKRVESGQQLSSAMTQYPLVFGATTTCMVRAGEESGRLGELFKNLAVWLEKDARVVQRSRQALVYPSLVLATSMLLGWVLFTFFLPPFFQAFGDAGTSLPWVTRMVMGMVKVVGSLWTWLLAIAVGLWLRRQLGRLMQDQERKTNYFRMLYKIPVVGRIVMLTTAVRFCNCLAVLLDCGVPLMRAWTLAAGASGNLAVEQDAIRVNAGLRTGHNLGDALGSSPLYPKGFDKMLVAAEEAAALSQNLISLSLIYEQDSEQALDALGVMIEPIFIMGMAVVVVTVLLAVLLPLYGSLAQLT